MGVTLPSITLAPLLRGFTIMFSSSWCVKRPKNKANVSKKFLPAGMAADLFSPAVAHGHSEV